MNTGHDWRDLLLKAASIVEEGWCQGSFHTNKNGAECYSSEAVRSCATGAISRANEHLMVPGPTTHHTDARAHLVKHLRGSIVLWNDSPDRTANEVAETMREVATWDDTPSSIAAEVMGWNDAPGRTATEVAEAMRQTATS